MEFKTALKFPVCFLSYAFGRDHAKGSICHGHVMASNLDFKCSKDPRIHTFKEMNGFRNIHDVYLHLKDIE